MSSDLAVVPSETPRDAAKALPRLTSDAPDDYELTVFLDSDFQNYSARDADGHWKTTYGRYEIGAGRKNGAWRSYICQVLAEDDEHAEHTKGPVLLDVKNQLDGPDPLTLLQNLLGGRAVLDGSHVIRGLNERQLDALRAASPALQTELIALTSRDWMKPGGDFARWFGRWALTA